MEYKVIKSKRKTIRLEITREGELIIKAPLNISDKTIKSIINKKSSWIKETLNKVKNEERKSIYNIDYNSEIPYLNKLLIIKSNSEINKIYIKDNILLAPENLDKETLEKKICNFLREESRKIFTERVDYYSKIIGKAPKKIRISNAKTRWGSMSSTGTLSLNPRLILFDMGVIDYVIIHELCHIYHMDHSKNFWNMVEKNCKDYKKQKEKLKNYQKQLMYDDWIEKI